MNASQKVTVEQVVEAYRSTGSVWKAAKRLGLCGQSVWERLRSIGHPMRSAKWTKAELAELTVLASNMNSIGDIARQLGRPYSGVAGKLSELQLTNRPRAKQAVRVRGLLAKSIAQQYLGLLPNFRGSLRQFAVSHGLKVDVLVKGLQRHFPTEWQAIAQARGMEPRHCEYCLQEFYPTSHKQRSCTRRCQSYARVNRQYFGGKRQDAVGLAEGVCQLCGVHKEHGLSVHHVFGKEHDPDNNVLVALCAGCHQVVERLAQRKFVEQSDGWENLVHLVLARRHAADPTKRHGVWCSVEWEWLTEEDIERELELEETA